MAIITNSIGTSGRDYSTIQAWEDALPANLVTDGNSYIGECYNDSEFTAGAAFSSTTSATYSITLTAAAGHSFQDHVNMRTNPLRYDQTKGVGVRATNTYFNMFSGTSTNININRLQCKTTLPNATRITYIFTGGFVKDMLAESAFIGFSGNGKFVNCVVLHKRDIYFHGAAFYTGSSGTFINCTAMQIRGITGPRGTVFLCENYAGGTIKNCVSLGFSTPISAPYSSFYRFTPVIDVVIDNQYSDRFGGQVSGVTILSLNYDSPFYSAGPYGSEDARPRLRGGLCNICATDAVNAPNDITGAPRGVRCAAGAWDIPVQAAKRTDIDVPCVLKSNAKCKGFYGTDGDIDLNGCTLTAGDDISITGTDQSFRFFNGVNYSMRNDLETADGKIEVDVGSVIIAGSNGSLLNIRDLDLDLAAGVLGTASYCSVYDSICTYTTAMMDANDGTNINAGGTNTGWDFGSAIPVFMNYYMQQGMV